MKPKPGMFRTWQILAEAIGGWMLALIVVFVLGFLGWRIWSAVQRIGNPFQKVAAEIGRAAEPSR
jgi:hypothetical protein